MAQYTSFEEKMLIFRWVYSSDGTKVQYFNWNGGQPNKLQNNEDCVGIGLLNNELWDDFSCTLEFIFICEKQAGKGNVSHALAIAYII